MEQRDRRQKERSHETNSVMFSDPQFCTSMYGKKAAESSLPLFLTQHTQTAHPTYCMLGEQVADSSAIFADFDLMEKLLAEWKNSIWPLPKVVKWALLNPFWQNKITEFGQLQKWPNLSDS
jgi:hypothetical protein